MWGAHCTQVWSADIIINCDNILRTQYREASAGDCRSPATGLPDLLTIGTIERGGRKYLYSIVLMYTMVLQPEIQDFRNPLYKITLQALCVVHKPRANSTHGQWPLLGSSSLYPNTGMHALCVFLHQQHLSSWLLSYTKFQFEWITKLKCWKLHKQLTAILTVLAAIL